MPRGVPIICYGVLGLLAAVGFADIVSAPEPGAFGLAGLVCGALIGASQGRPVSRCQNDGRGVGR